MPEKQTIDRVQKAKREGKSASTQAGEFIREEIHHIRERKHGARSTKQAIAIGLSKARRSGVKLAPPRKGKVSESTRRNAERDYQAGRRKRSHASTKRSKARERALKREGHSAASRKALRKQARPPRENGRHRPAQTLVDAQRTPRVSMDARWPRVRRHALAPDENKVGVRTCAVEIWTITRTFSATATMRSWISK